VDRYGGEGDDVTKRAEFSLKTKQAAYQRAGGRCECGCERTFGKHPKERPEYHHRVEAILEGGNDLDNCWCIRADCHAAITANVSAPRAAKVRREDKRQTGLTRPKRKIPGRRFNGEPIYPERN